MKAGADFKQTGDASVHLDPARRWFRNTREHFQPRGLAGAVATDNSQHFTRGDLKRDVVQCRHRTVCLVPFETFQWSLDCLRDGVAKRVERILAGAELILLADAGGSDDRLDRKSVV